MSSSPLLVPHINCSHHEHTGAAKQKKRYACVWMGHEKKKNGASSVHSSATAIFFCWVFFFPANSSWCFAYPFSHATCVCVLRASPVAFLFCLSSTFLLFVSQLYENKRSLPRVFAFLFFRLQSFYTRHYAKTLGESFSYLFCLASTMLDMLGGLYIACQL